MLIRLYRDLGCCINEIGSGLLSTTDRIQYDKKYIEEHPDFQEHLKKYKHQWYEDNKESHNKKSKQWYEEHLEEKKKYDKERRESPEWKVYDRVHTFNRYHPDLAVETPKEARDKYLATGYIPQYIKHNDL